MTTATADGAAARKSTELDYAALQAAVKDGKAEVTTEIQTPRTPAHPLTSAIWGTRTGLFRPYARQQEFSS
jgi:hypothetical protein